MSQNRKTGPIHLHQDRGNVGKLGEAYVAIEATGAFLNRNPQALDTVKDEPGQVDWIRPDKGKKALRITGIVISEAARQLGAAEIPMILVANAMVDGHTAKNGRALHDIGAVTMSVPRGMIVGKPEIIARHQSDAA